MRTDPTTKHDGISFLLIDMKTPESRCVLSRLSPGSRRSRSLFTDVVPKENLVGELNKGWTIAKRLLQFERDATTNSRQLAGDTRPVGEIAKEYVGVDEQGRIADPDIRARVVKHMMNFEALPMQGRC